MTALKICRFLAGDAVVRVGLVGDDGDVVDLTRAGITTLSHVLESADPVALLNGIRSQDAAAVRHRGRHASTAHRAAGSVGGGRDVFAQQDRAHGGIRLQRDGIRQGVRRRSPGDFLQGDRGESGGDRRRGRHPPRCDVERARAGAGARAQLAWTDRRLHDRQRHELARHRRGEPLVSAAGEGLRPLVRAGSVDPPRAWRKPTRATGPCAARLSAAARPCSPERRVSATSSGASKSSPDICAGRNHFHMVPYC